MKYLFLFLIAIMPLSLSAEKKVSKFYCTDDNETETCFLNYDENGHLTNWKLVDNQGIAWYDQTIEYVSKDKVIVSGIFDGCSGTIEVFLNESGLASSAYYTCEDEDEEDGVFRVSHSFSYSNGVLSKVTIIEDNEVSAKYVITNGNPTQFTSDDISKAIITYSDKPNKCGLIYLPMITNYHSHKDFYALVYAGLQGSGSANLPYSCDFQNKYGESIIDYVIDDEGYVTSMDIKTGEHGDGHYVFEYCEVNGVDDAETAAVEVSGGKNCIIVKGKYESVKVYNLSGMQCDAATDLAPGIYIVDVDNAKSKVWVH